MVFWHSWNKICEICVFSPETEWVFVTALTKRMWWKWCCMTSKDSLEKVTHILLFFLGQWPGATELSCVKSHYPELPHEDRYQVERDRPAHRTQHQMLVKSLPYVPALPWERTGLAESCQPPTPLFWSSLLHKNKLEHTDISLLCFLYTMLTH